LHIYSNYIDLAQDQFEVSFTLSQYHKACQYSEKWRNLPSKTNYPKLHIDSDNIDLADGEIEFQLALFQYLKVILAHCTQI
jgi:hypothetical protein